MGIIEKIRAKKSERVLRAVENEHILKRVFMLLMGELIIAISYNLFFLKNNIVYGGLSGLSIILKTYIDPATFILIGSIILLIISYFTLGKEKTINSLVGSIVFPLFIKLTQNIGDLIYIENDNLLLIALIGGICVGIGSGIVFKAGYTSGGTDIINQICSKYLKMSLGTAMIVTDGLIVLTGGFFFGWTRVLYGAIVLYIITLMVDKVVLGIASTKALYINTSEEEQISNYLISELNLGVTIIESRGGYTNKKQHMIMSVISTSDYFKVKEGILKIDDNALIIATDAYQSQGIYSGKRGED